MSELYVIYQSVIIELSDLERSSKLTFYHYNLEKYSTCHIRS